MINELPFCECGCGGRVSKPGNRFIQGHNNCNTPWKPKQEPQLCECGCGGYTEPGNRFIKGHNQRGCVGGFNGRTHTKETKEKMHNSQIKHHKEHPMSDATRQKMRESHTGEKNPNYGGTISEEHKDAIREANIGKVVTEETRILLSCAHQGISRDDWEGFAYEKSELYCNLFNSPLKETIREYFNNKCFMDKKPQKNGNLLDVHHVNYDKRCGCDATQFCIFIPVTRSWNTIFNGNKDKNRWHWYQFLMNKIFIEHPNYFTYHIPVWGMNELEYNYDYVFEKFRRR